jgi:hypothetical protein
MRKINVGLEPVLDSSLITYYEAEGDRGAIAKHVSQSDVV